MTRRDERVAGITALATAVLLAVSLVLLGAGPASRHPNAVLAWSQQHALGIRMGSLVWLVAMLALVTFAVRLRDALLMLTADRWWAAALFLQGAAVFATTAVVASATGWATAELAASPYAEADNVATLWVLHRTLLRFATWGLIPPLLTSGVALIRHSILGQVAAVGGAIVAVALLAPLTWLVGLPAFVVWLAITGVALVRPGRRRSADRQPVG